MTTELSQLGLKVRPMSADAPLLARRLARYREQGLLQRGMREPPGTRSAGEPVGPAPIRPVRPGSTLDPDTRASLLAQALGGRVEATTAGSVVWLEETREISIELDRLMALPYPIDPFRPLVCLDTETTGLGTAAGTIVFLVGLGWWEGSRYIVRQLFLPEQSVERAFLDALESALPRDAWLVTYNGRTFDWPLLETRYRLHGRPAPAHAGHFDLLPVARQLWRHRLSDARLATVEAGVADVRRLSDLPGQFIPDRYFGYLETGRASLLREVALHNRQDVVSLAHLLVEMTTRLASRAGRRLAHPGDVGALGRAYVRHGRLEDGLECYEIALEASTASSGATLQLAQLVADRARVLARLGRRHEAAGAWLDLALARGYLSAAAWIEVAKYREHVQRDPVDALRAADEAAALAARSRFRGMPLRAVERDLGKRRARLRRKINARKALLVAA